MRRTVGATVLRPLVVTDQHGPTDAARFVFERVRAQRGSIRRMRAFQGPRESASIAELGLHRDAPETVLAMVGATFRPRLGQ